MNKHIILVCALIAGGCGPRSEPDPVSLPPELPGPFRLEQTAMLPADEAPELVRQLAVSSTIRGSYQGSAPLTVTLYEMRSSAAAFELVQKWRPAPGSIFFHSGAHFVLIESPGLDYNQLSALAAALESRLSAPAK